MGRKSPSENQHIWEEAKRWCATTTMNSRVPLAWGADALVTDYDGKKYIHLHSEVGVMNLGFGHARVANVLIEQIITGIMGAHHNDAPSKPSVDACKLLATRAPVKKPAKVYLGNSGTEANEAAIKACKAYRYHRGEKSLRAKAIYFFNSFHGRTLGSLPGTTSKPEVQQYPFLDHCDNENSIYLPYPTREHFPLLKEELKRIAWETVNYLLIELPCQGEGGIIPVDEEILQYLYECVRLHDVIWISDCVQCGIGRTGTLFGADCFPWLESDILTLGKALAGGIPIGATIFHERFDFQPGEHSSTFGGNPLASSVIPVVIEEVERIIENNAVSEIESILYTRLNRMRHHSSVIDVRGRGAMWGIEFAAPEIQKRIIDIGENELVRHHTHGLKLLGAGKKTIRIMPPLTIEPKTLERAMDLFALALKRYARLK